MLKYSIKNMAKKATQGNSRPPLQAGAFLYATTGERPCRGTTTQITPTTVQRVAAHWCRNTTGCAVLSLIAPSIPPACLSPTVHVWFCVHPAPMGILLWRCPGKCRLISMSQGDQPQASLSPESGTHPLHTCLVTSSACPGWWLPLYRLA